MIKMFHVYNLNTFIYETLGHIYIVLAVWDLDAMCYKKWENQYIWDQLTKGAALKTKHDHIVTCSSAMFKSLINVIAFINEIQVLMYDKSNFIINPQYIYKYIHSKHVE